MTRKLPTFSHSATQRVESFYSAIKVQGTLISTIKTWTLDEVVIYHETTVDKNLKTTLEKFKDLIKKEIVFSKEANKMFSVELRLMGVCWIVEKWSERDFVVGDSKSKVKKKMRLGRSSFFQLRDED
eukprot:snap_masked-scaffold_28-processed-gene-4.28-mRNA-1 protein AED:1.00 eAED:1.00 QI:0/0/0/0/1/1/2/0/126